MGLFLQWKARLAFARPEPAVALGRLRSDPATESSLVGVDMRSPSCIVGTEIDGLLGSFKGSITGKTRTGSSPKGAGGESGAGGANGGAIPAIEDLRIHYPGREVGPRSL